MSTITSAFSAASTASDVVAGKDLTGQKIIVTGGASGIGLESARALAKAGAEVVLAVRTPEKGARAVHDIGGNCRAEPLDLADQSSIEAFAGRHASTPLNTLICNAGVMATPCGWTAKGFETQIGTNHFGHALLTMLLQPALAAAAPARVIMLTSLAHIYAGVDFDDMHYRERPYDKWQAYGQSKSANALFAVGLSRAWGSAGIFANAAMPGGIMTDLQRELDMAEMTALGWFDADGNPHPMFKSPEQGAATTVWAATDPQLATVGGLYLEDCAQSGAWHPETSPFAGVAAHASDPAIADRLWAETRKAWGL
jgi:NAD(P)-dependent dehydrogenase (short-subunit alcohol dehydrogenase family)